MTAALISRLARFTDQGNSILIREMRRALNGRLFPIIYMTLLTGCVIVSLSGDTPYQTSGERGVTLFNALFAVFSGACYLAIPLMTTLMVQAEVKEKTLELISITTLSASRIVWGELLTACGVFAILTSAVAPFMAFSYLLGGVDFRYMLTAIVFVFLVSLSITIIMLSLSTQSRVQILTLLFCVGLSVMAFFYTAALIWNPFSSSFLVDMWEDPQTMWATLAGLGGSLSFVFIFYMLAVSRFTFESANRSAPVRYAVFLHLASVAVLSRSFTSSSSDVLWFWTSFSLYALCILFLAGVGSLGEEELLTRRQLRRGRWKWLPKSIWAIFLPGVSRGMGFVIWTGLMLSLVAFVDAKNQTPTSSYRGDYEASLHIVPVIGFSYLIIFLRLSILIVNVLPLTARKPVLRRSMPFLLLLLTILIPLFAALITQSDIDRGVFLMTLNPFFFFAKFLDSSSDMLLIKPFVPAILVAGGICLVSQLIPTFRGIRAASREAISRRPSPAATE